MPLHENKICTGCGSDLIWVGSVMDGKMVCPKDCDPAKDDTDDDDELPALVGDEW